MGIVHRYLWASVALLMVGGCVPAARPKPVGMVAAGAACRTPSVTIAFDFDGAPPLACSIAGDREVTLLVTPEHAPPINPSPWFAFRYETAGEAPVTVTLRYLEGGHRYARSCARASRRGANCPPP
ncbi:hypothetical protein [Porphyrobacter sp. LM 6]|uniref:hypothetical protein n=1 Tax=Porphyrobacter sp. LM 6 TaxID=1896196 RepID=UPI000863C280|nr:hypothetical protein [Porphyrobacter sp. LM 6]AOL95784.1 hypothetical protein BG023_112886 [Porphyrobacter sp. LM 6]